MRGVSSPSLCSRSFDASAVDQLRKLLNATEVNGKIVCKHCALDLGGVRAGVSLACPQLSPDFQ